MAQQRMAAMRIALQRLYQQRLSANPFASPEEVVAWMGAVQAQDFPGAKWALGLRMQSAADGVIERAFTEGAILRTHVMRPTWHFVTPEDIRWMLALTAPRVHAVNGTMYRRLELDDALLRRSHEAIAKALEGGKHLTRAELGAALAEIGIDTANGMRLGYIVHHAELEGMVCSGPRRGKQFTYALLDERAPQARTLARDEALAELTQRYFTSHGPATVKDFAWWSGLTVADAKAGLAMLASQLASEGVDGQTYWFSDSIPQLPEPSHEALLLPTYDEYVIGYTDRSAMFDASQAETLSSQRGNMAFDSLVILDGHAIGSWRRAFSKGAAVIELAPFAPLTTAEVEAVGAAARRFGEFLGMPVSVEEVTVEPKQRRTTLW